MGGRRTPRGCDKDGCHHSSGCQLVLQRFPSNCHTHLVQMRKSVSSVATTPVSEQTIGTLNSMSHDDKNMSGLLHLQHH